MSLNNIIRSVPFSARATSPAPGFSLFAVHVEKLKVSEQVPFLFAKDYKYFHISGSGRDILGPHDRTVSDDQGQRRKWRIHLGPVTGSSLPNQLALSTALHGDAEDLVWKIVNETVDATIHLLGASGESAVTKPSTSKFEEINRAIAAALQASLGLTVSPSVRPAIDIKPVEHYKTEEFQVKLQDMRAEDILRVCLEVDVQYPISQVEREALIGVLPDREDIILDLQAATQTWLARNIQLQQFCYEEDQVRSALMEQCAAVLPRGSTMLSLSLHWQNPFKRDFLTEATKAVACKVGTNLTPMTIHHTLSIQLVDIAKWRKARVPDEDLGRWIEARLEAITASVLSQKSYVEVMTKFADIKESIKKPFAKEINAIGFEATQHIAHTQNRELEKILETRTFDVETADGEFATKSGTVRFGLRVAAQIKLADLDKVTGFIEPNADFKAPFVEALRSGAEQAIRKLTPESLYEVFHSDNEHASSAETEDDPTVINVTPDGERTFKMGGFYERESAPADEFIKQHIRQALAMYNANQEKSHDTQTGKDIDLTFVPTAMDRIYAALRPRAPKPLELQIEAQDETGGETVKIDMMYALHIAKKGWIRFHQQCHNLLSDPSFAEADASPAMKEAKAGKAIADNIRDLIKQNAESKLGLMPLEFFATPTAGGSRMAEAIALYGFSPTLQASLQNGVEPPAQSDSVVKRLEDDFGIRVASRGFRINLTASQTDLRTLREKQRAHEIALLDAVHKNELEDIAELSPEDAILQERKKASTDAYNAAKTAVTEDSPLAPNREKLRRMAGKLTDVFGSDEDKDKQTPPEGEPKP